MKAKTPHFPIIDFGARGGLNVPLNLSKIVGFQNVPFFVFREILEPLGCQVEMVRQGCG